MSQLWSATILVLNIKVRKLSAVSIDFSRLTTGRPVPPHRIWRCHVHFTWLPIIAYKCMFSLWTPLGPFLYSLDFVCKHCDKGINDIFLLAPSVAPLFGHMPLDRVIGEGQHRWDSRGRRLQWQWNASQPLALCQQRMARTKSINWDRNLVICQSTKGQHAEWESLWLAANYKWCAGPGQTEGNGVLHSFQISPHESVMHIILINF